MRLIHITFVGIWILSFSLKPNDERLWEISDESVVEITGTTNISSFRCESLKYPGGEFLTERFTEDGNTSVWNGEIMLKSRNFDCLNPMMTKDFRSTINAEKHPFIRVKFLDLIQVSENSNQTNLRGNVEITLAGVSKIYPISCVFSEKKAERALLAGSKKLSFSDFNLQAPEKFFGTIKVNDSLSVNFGLVLAEM